MWKKHEVGVNNVVEEPKRLVFGGGQGRKRKNKKNNSWSVKKRRSSSLALLERLVCERVVPSACGVFGALVVEWGFVESVEWWR